MGRDFGVLNGEIDYNNYTVITCSDIKDQGFWYLKIPK